jgi:hypothetical protein
MLVSKQLTDTLLDNARIIRKESLELRHECRHTMCISRILRHLAQKERKSFLSSPLILSTSLPVHVSIHIILR